MYKKAFEFFRVKICCHSHFNPECNMYRKGLYRLTVSFTIETVHTLANNEIFRFSLWTSLVIAGCRIVMEVFADLKSNEGTMVIFKIVFCCIVAKIRLKHSSAWSRRQLSVSFHFGNLVFGNEVTIIQKFYVIFVYLIFYKYAFFKARQAKRKNPGIPYSRE